MCAHVEEEVAGTSYYPIWWERFKFQELSTCACVCVCVVYLCETDVTLCVGLLPANSVCVLCVRVVL